MPNSKLGQPTNASTKGVPADDKVADPHPATEEHYDRIPHPGGANPPKEPRVGPNSYAHDGTSPPRPNYDRKQPE